MNHLLIEALPLAFQNFKSLVLGEDDLLLYRTGQKNAWFTPENVREAILSVEQWFNTEALEKWMSAYPQLPAKSPKTIGIVAAGNIPMVALHDVLAVLLSGNKLHLKLSEQDDVLIPLFIAELEKLYPPTAKLITNVVKLNAVDALIATGTDATAVHFNHYFKHIPRIIRRNRNSVALLNGTESREELNRLGKDIFSYFGLGCRNVSAVMVPSDYEFITFYESIESFKTLTDNHRYNNHYDYNKSVLLVNQMLHLDNGFLLLEEKDSITSPISMLYYQRYENLNEAVLKLSSMQEKLQCVVCKPEFGIANSVDFGKTQEPGLNSYADGADTLQWLSDLQ